VKRKTERASVGSPRTAPTRRCLSSGVFGYEREMTQGAIGRALLISATLGAGAPACGTSGHHAGPGGGTNEPGGAGTSSSGTVGQGASGTPSTGGTTSGAGGTAAGGVANSAGGTHSSGGSGASSSAGTSSAGTSSAGTSSAGASSSAGGAGAGCTVGPWPSADPTVAGPFATVTETNVGPAAGEGADGGAPVAFTLFRPKDLTQGGLCHPVVTWGNGTGANPSLYKVLLNQLASHGFIVIASDSPNVGQGDPPPMVAGVTWVLSQNDDPSSELYRQVDTAHVGATGHSQGGFATTTAGGDSSVTTIAALCGASPQRNLHGPALLYCGGMDTTVPCSTIQNTFNGISNQPVMLAEFLAADHASWITFRGSTPSPVEATVTAWMRVHLMGDTALRSWFYGPSCKLCTDSAWQVTQKMMDQ
jgi:dienelactone hydrolase